MLCAILSDTVLFRSPTTTDADRRAAALLSDGEEERLKNMLAAVRRAMAETEGNAR